MYTVTKGHNKFVAKTRRGINQKLDSFEVQRELNRKSCFELGQHEEMSSPKPVFHQVNGKQKSSNQRVSPDITPHQEDVIKYISDEWNKVSRDYESSKHQTVDGRTAPTIAYYKEKSPASLQNFKPFDLETWWGQRLFNTLKHNT